MSSQIKLIKMEQKPHYCGRIINLWCTGGFLGSNEVRLSHLHLETEQLIRKGILEQSNCYREYRYKLASTCKIVKVVDPSRSICFKVKPSDFLRYFQEDLKVLLGTDNMMEMEPTDDQAITVCLKLNLEMFEDLTLKLLDGPVLQIGYNEKEIYCPLPCNDSFIGIRTHLDEGFGMFIDLKMVNELELRAEYKVTEKDWGSCRIILFKDAKWDQTTYCTNVCSSLDIAERFVELDKEEENYSSESEEDINNGESEEDTNNGESEEDTNNKESEEDTNNGKSEEDTSNGYDEKKCEMFSMFVKYGDGFFGICGEERIEVQKEMIDYVFQEQAGLSKIPVMNPKRHAGFRQLEKNRARRRRKNMVLFKESDIRALRKVNNGYMGQVQLNKKKVVDVLLPNEYVLKNFGQRDKVWFQRMNDDRSGHFLKIELGARYQVCGILQ